MATKTLVLPPTRAGNYAGPERGRPVSSSAPRRVSAWETTLESELDHHASLIPRSFVEPVPRGDALKRYRTRDLLSSHAQRVASAELRGKTDPESAVLAGSVVKWQLHHRSLAAAAGARRQSSAVAATAARPRTAAGYVHYVPETPAEDRMNARWQQYREEEVVMARNDASMQRALAAWQRSKGSLEQEVTRRIENRRRPLTSTTAAGMTFAGGISGAMEAPGRAGLAETMAAVHRAHLDSDSDGEERRTPPPTPSQRPSTGGPRTARRTDFAPQAARPVTAASIASMGSVGTADTSAALHRQRLRVPVVVPRGSTAAAGARTASPRARTPGAAAGLPTVGSGTWGGGDSAQLGGGGGGVGLPPLTVTVSQEGGELDAFSAPDGGVGAGQRFPARAIATPVFRQRKPDPVFRGGLDPALATAAPTVPRKPAGGKGSARSSAKRSPRSRGGPGGGGPPPKYTERVASQSWGAGMLSTRPSTATAASLTPLEAAMMVAAEQEAAQTAASSTQHDVDEALAVFHRTGFRVSRAAVERAMTMTPSAVKRISPDYHLTQLQAADAAARAESAGGGGGRPSTSPRSASARPSTAASKGKGKGKGKGKSSKAPFVPAGMQQMDVTGGASGAPSVAAPAMFLPSNPLEELAVALAAGKKKSKKKGRKKGRKK